MVEVRLAVARRPHTTTTALHGADLAGFVDGLALHEIRIVAGLDVASLRERLAAAAPPARPLLLIDPGAAETAEALADLAIGQLASAVAELWPCLWGGEDFSALRDDALSRAHLPIRLAALAGRVPQMSQSWARDIVLRLLAGRPARAPGAAPALAWGQLVRAFAPTGLTLAIPLRHHNGEGFVRGIEWLAAHAPVAIVVLAEQVPEAAGFERILFGARHLAAPARVAEAANERANATPRPDAAGPMVLALPAAEGRPHPQSATELRLYRLIQADADLRPLFAFNIFVPDLPLLQAKADLAWLGGRVIVEIDGHEHRGAAKFRADRHRDYVLMCAGYFVLRMTNEDVATDAALAIEKIRAVVSLARKEGR